MKYFILLTIIALALAAPAQATVTTSTANYAWEIYKNTDMKGTTAVTFRTNFVAKVITVQNIGTSGDIQVTMPEDTVPSTAAFITLKPGSTIELKANSDIALMTAITFWSSETCSVEVLAERGR